MSPIVGQNYTEKNILPVLQELLKDESSEVRLNVVSNLNKLAEIAGSSLLSPALLTILNNLTKD
jgi:serine/threonine-protein phosphatase 2A regulatory subunit A